MNLDPYRNETPPRREDLPGGAVLLSVPMRTAHAVTLGVWLRTGSQDYGAHGDVLRLVGSLHPARLAAIAACHGEREHRNQEQQ